MKQKDFVNTLPYISNPIEEFRDYKFVSWERDIYPKFKGKTKEEEIDFFVDIIIKNNLKNIIDFGVGGGTEISGILETMNKRKFLYENVEANEVDEDFINQAQRFYTRKNKMFLFIERTGWICPQPVLPTIIFLILGS